VSRFRLPTLVALGGKRFLAPWLLLTPGSFKEDLKRVYAYREEKLRELLG
jgi:hypothetical protein